MPPQPPVEPVTTSVDVQPTAKETSRLEATYSRREVRARDNGKCVCCARNVGPIAVVHHVIPTENGGSGNPENLETLCPSCHALVHLLMRRPEEYPFAVQFAGDNAAERIRSLAEAPYVLGARGQANP